MKSRKSLEDFLTANQVDCSHWPTSESELFEQLEAFDFSDKVPEGHEKRMTEIGRAINRQISIPEKATQKTFWDLPEKGNRELKQSRLDLYDIVRAAYLETFDGASTDLVIADPDRNCLFVHECWKQGATVSQSELNKLLMNARKANRIGKVEGVNRFSINRRKLDEFMFASESGLRILQEQEHYENERWITLDDILCEPQLGKRFFELANSIIPGYSALEYRWAALNLRKGINRTVGTKESESSGPNFVELGKQRSVKASAVPSKPGLFWLRSSKTDFYIGHAQDLRNQIEILNDVQIEQTLKTYNAFTFFDEGPMVFSIAPVENLSPSDREPLKSQLVCQREPRMNVTKRGERLSVA